MPESPDNSFSSSSSSSAAGNRREKEKEKDAGEVVQCCHADTWISRHHSPPSDEHTIARLIDSEPHFMPVSDYLSRCRSRSVDITARQDSINWILKVHAYHHFSPVTALLAVNYFDRFLSSHRLPVIQESVYCSEENARFSGKVWNFITGAYWMDLFTAFLLRNAQESGWPFQLLSVACLSLAAKMEEPHMPLLEDLQVLEPRFVFEPRTIQRMELRVMANLNWRLRSVTAFDYLDYFISELPSSSSHDPNQLFKASSDLILSTTRVIDFLGFRPSTVAAAAVMCAVGGRNGDVAAESNGQLFHERVNKEMVKSCHQLMEEYMVDTCPSALLKNLTAEQHVAPPSPVGVLDAAAACVSCDTRSENPGSSSQAGNEQQPAKRLRSSAPDVQQP